MGSISVPGSLAWLAKPGCLASKMYQGLPGISLILSPLEASAEGDKLTPDSSVKRASVWRN